MTPAVLDACVLCIMALVQSPAYEASQIHDSDD
jgi:hypothetical protein